MKIKKFLFISLLLGTLTSSCVSKSKIVYLNGMNESKTSVIKTDVKLQSDDILLIVVTSENPEITIPYNLKQIIIMGDNVAQGGQQQRQLTYLIDKKGEINFPIVGNISVAGLT
ncbi:MAG: polysaccharide biosynthesis/export family protein, partial [Flavobacterium sp.]|nr:polysaccharide biosynthesis/export family protein [Flavobacterium sp.]